MGRRVLYRMLHAYPEDLHTSQTAHTSCFPAVSRQHKQMDRVDESGLVHSALKASKHLVKGRTGDQAAFSIFEASQHAVFSVPNQICKMSQVEKPGLACNMLLMKA